MKGPRYSILYTLLILLVSSLFPSTLLADHFLYKQIALNSRLPSTLNCIYTDTRGFVWTGTKFGLGRFDGHEQKRYIGRQSDPNSLPSNQIFQIQEDSIGNLWILTDMGVARYDYRNDNFIPLYNELGNRLIAYSVCRWQGKLLFGCTGKVYAYDSATGTLEEKFMIGTDQMLEITKLVLPTPDTPLCVSRWRGIYAIDLKTGVCKPAPFKCGKEISVLFVDSKQRIWIAPYNQGLHCYDIDGNEIASYTTRNSELSNNIVICVAERKGLIWIGTDGGGINLLNPENNRITHLEHVPGDKLYSLPTNSINCLYNDSYNNIWIGGVYNGLINMREVSMKTYTEVAEGNSLGLSHNIVLCLYRESPNRIWIGTDGGGINSFNPATERFTHYLSTDEDKITSLCEFTPGKLLAAAFSQGLFVFDTATGQKTPFTVIDEKTTHTLSQRGYSVYLHRNTPNTILLLSDHVYIYNIKEKKFSIAAEAEPNLIKWGTLQAITHTKDHTYLFDSKRIYELDHRTQILRSIFSCNSEMAINSVAYNPNTGIFWIGTNQGLSQFVPSENKLQTVQTKLFSDVSLVVCGSEDEIWIGSESMLYSYSPQEDRFIIYGESDGAMPNEYIPRSQLVVPGEGVYMGGVKGLLYIANERNLRMVSPPELQVSDIILNGESAYSQLDKNEDELSVPWNSNIVIQIMAKEEDILREKWYRYRIKGMDNTYTETYNPEIVIRAPRPGSYKIMASCTSKDGSWIPERQVLVLNVLPPWYQTWWFIIGCGLVIALFIIEIFRRILKNKEHKLQWAMKEHEKQVYEEKVRFLINVSHELRTPLTLIYSPLCRILKSLPTDSPQYQPLKAIFRQSQRMKALINTVLDLRKMEVGGGQLHIQPYPFNEWVKQVAQDFASEGMAEQINLCYQLSPQIETVSFDKDKCEIVLSNLLANALKHSPQNSTITIASELLPGGQEIRLSISDQGCGLQQVNMDKLFTRFYQGNGEQNGTGIGLSYSKILVEQHGGSIGARNNDGAGATFYFDLPLKQGSENIDCPPKAYLNELISDEHNKLPVEGSSFDVSAYTVLVVDDNPDMTDFLKKSLADYFKEIWIAPDGVEALKLAKNYTPDIIVSDVMMPRMNGYQLCQQLKEDINVSHIPVILLTARDDNQSQQDGYKNGADAYLTKPFDIDTLLELIRNRLKGRDYNRKRYMNAGPIPIPEETTFSQADETFLLKLNRIIQDNLDNCDLDINFICKEIGMSRASLYNKLKALTNMSTNEYVNKFRMEKAIQLIHTTDMPFTEIAEKVGFATPSYFSTAFKQYTGETPTQYKKKKRAESQ
ncbi:MAG: response regulator [Bacteroides sp.]|nr:response regulator [Bacteroides sp.]